jgi:endonuclease YncB( thermonuclease family)
MRLFLAVAALFCTAPSIAAPVAFDPQGMGQPPATITCDPAKPGEPVWIEIKRIKDGDTFEGTCTDRFGFPEIYRIGNLDTPEKGGFAKCKRESIHAGKASGNITTWAAASEMKALVVVGKAKEKYGRYLNDAWFFADGQFLGWAQIQISDGFALPYDGGKKGDWCAILKGKVK